MSQCVKCGASMEGAVYRNTLCPSCGAELHSCANCRHYAKGQPYDCRESIQEPVNDKNRANFCDFFQINTRTGSPEERSHSESSKDAFNALFGE